MRPIEDFAVLEVYRLVRGENAANFIDRVRTVAQLVTSSQATTVLQMELEVGNSPVITAAGFPYVKVYDANELRLPLLERKSPKSDSNKLFAASRQLRSGVIRKGTGGNSPGTDTPLADELYQLQLEYDLPQRDRLLVPFDSIGVRFSGDVRNGEHELTISPDLSAIESHMLIAQSKRVANKLQDISQRVAYPNNPTTLGIPFASVRKGIPQEESRRFRKQVESLLPLYVELGEVKVL
ncbi:MAG: hypothetical protein M3Q70_03270 [bacterium]|nr:hypothetical protein [bacterium]